MDGNERAIVSFTGLAHALVHTYELSTPIFVVVWLTEFPVTTATLGTVVAVGYVLGLFADSALAAEFDLASSLYVGLLTVGIGGQYAGGKLTDRIPTPWEWWLSSRGLRWSQWPSSPPLEPVSRRCLRSAPS